MGHVSALFSKFASRIPAKATRTLEIACAFETYSGVGVTVAAD